MTFLDFDIIGHTKGIVRDRFPNLDEAQIDQIVNDAVEQNRISDFETYLNEVEVRADSEEAQSELGDSGSPLGPGERGQGIDPDNLIEIPDLTDPSNEDTLGQETPGQDPTHAEGYGARLRNPGGMFTSEFLDTDGDGVDDRDQTGPGGDTPHTINGDTPGDPSAETQLQKIAECNANGGMWNGTECVMPNLTNPDLLDPNQDDNPSMSADEFAGLLAEVGIPREFAMDVWTTFADRFTDPAYTGAQAMLDIYDEDAFKRRFPGITAMREDATTDRAIPTPGDYLKKEQYVFNLLRSNDIDPATIDGDTLVETLFVNGVSNEELSQRLQGAQNMLNSVPQEVRDTFIEWYGQGATGNLMKAFLDPDDAWGGSWVEVGDKASAAFAAGRAGMMGIDIDRIDAEAIGRLGITQPAITQRLTDLNVNAALYREIIGENVDLDLEREGLEAAFDIDSSEMTSQEIRNKIARRRADRAARFGGGGGTMIGQTGTGLGVAR